MHQLTGLKDRDDLVELINNFDEKILLTSVLYDIDSFKGVNDVFGFEYGDGVLIKLGNLLTDYNQDYQGYIFKFVGDEFFHVLPNKTNKEIVDIATGFVNLVQSQNIPYGHRYSSRKILTVSAAIFFDFPSSAEKYLQNIDRVYKGIRMAKEPYGFAYNNGFGGFEEHSKVITVYVN